jgi:16S rRNA (adenine1518-N6/adenine1519-N6)-dimethyltransferase
LNLSDPKTLRAFLDRHGLIARKSLGQHFLCSASAVNAILARLGGFRGALEIGPGPGVLTGPLSEALETVIALEVDTQMISALAESAPGADVRRQDALKSDLVAILEELPAPRAIVSNLPYYITAPLITAITESLPHFEKAVLMMQKEVGERILAPAGDRRRGSLSVYLQTQYQMKKVANVPAGAFLPPPKVDSVILELTPFFATHATPEFFAFVRLGFTQPRKTLVNNLTSGEGRAKTEEALSKVGLSSTIRPHEVSLYEWGKLFDELKQK